MYLKIRSRNRSANLLRKQIVTDHPAVFRLGSFTPTRDIFKNCRHPELIQEINTVQACKTSNDKYLMKCAFDEHNVKTAKWCLLSDEEQIRELRFPTIIKHVHSSRGNGIFYVENIEAINDLNLNNLENYIIEEYKTYSREYRIHVDKFGCFLTHRKMLRNDAEVRWHRHHINTVWIVEDNPMFDKPSNWDEIVEECQKAIKAVGLDIGCVDVKVQNNKHEHPEFIILETNSAPALGEDSAEKYKSELILLTQNNI